MGPINRTFEFLRHSVAENQLTSNTKLFNYGLMDKYYCVKEVDATWGPKRPERKFLKKDKQCTSTAVKVAKLDDLLPVLRTDGVKEAIIKIDVGGSEAKAMLGGSKLLRQIDVPVIQMQFGIINQKYHTDPY